MEGYDRGFNTWAEAFEFAFFAAKITEAHQRVRRSKDGLEWLVEVAPRKRDFELKA